MRRPEFGFEDPLLGEEERLLSLLALNRGLFSAWAAVCRRLDGYASLVEQEVEGNPAALAYLARLEGLAHRAAGWPVEAAGLFGSEREFESISLRPLLEGAVERCAKLLAPERSLRLLPLPCELVVPGVFFELQQVLVRLFLRHVREQDGTGEADMVLGARELMLDEAASARMGGTVAPGQIVQISLGREGGAPPPPDQLESFWDVALGAAGGTMPDLRAVQAYGTILQHGGDLRFQGVGDGLQLHILLPATVRRQEMQVVSNIQEQDLYGTETILLVDDEDMIWDVIIDMLQELGYSVVLAGNGREAIDIYRENPGGIDLVLLDMVMPEMDGHQAFFKLREINPAVRVLLSSGYVSEDDVRDVLEAGAAGFLRKPYRMVELARKARAILDA
ncbi:MAG: response regulator [Lentisphaeria bacterium]|jgi:CheY-like chemotaxis protein|nr:response regulator [Lentisphaeria bacterium]